ncbi:Gamma-glutamyl hydrolase [Trichinella spiralis]|uniref:folate gamma-glutamyl hydrolase n=1 Tax=Trichinella spiralis TaxID=6334 RepID=A0ABR3KYQ6_TRISP
MNNFNGVLLLVILSFGNVICSVEKSNMPVIGILTVDTSYRDRLFGNSTLPSSYVYLLKAAGAKIVPLLLSYDVNTHRNLFNQINGLFVPGGSVAPFEADVYKILKLYTRWAIRSNDNGDYFPIWGTCLGFEMLLLYFSNGTGVLENRLFRDVPYELYYKMKTELLSPNFHHWCSNFESLKRSGLENIFIPTTVSQSKIDRITFISSIEHVHYPFYGVAWHPEKNIFEDYKAWHLSKSDAAVELAHYLARFFVKEAMKSKHQFSPESFFQYSISNFCPLFSKMYGLKEEENKPLLIDKRHVYGGGGGGKVRSVL